MKVTCKEHVDEERLSRATTGRASSAEDRRRNERRETPRRECLMHRGHSRFLFVGFTRSVARGFIARRAITAAGKRARLVGGVSSRERLCVHESDRATKATLTANR